MADVQEDPTNIRGYLEEVKRFLHLPLFRNDVTCVS